MATNRFSALALGVSALVLIASSASAQDANAVAERLKATLAAQGTELGWSAVSGSGGQVVLEGATFSAAGTPGKFDAGKIVLDGVTDDNGGYRIATATFPDYAFSKDGISFDMKGANLKGIRLAAAGSTDPLAAFLFYDTADIATVNVKVGDKQVFTMDGMHAMNSAPTNGPMSFTVDIPKMTADLSTVPDPAAKKVIDGLGYQTLNGNVKVAGSWNPSDGQIAVTQYDMNVDNAGSLGLTMDFSGYTPTFIKSLQDLQKQMAAQPQGGDNSAQGMAVLGLLQQLTFNSAGIKFTDASITGKVLDYVGKQQGMSAKDLANQAKAILPFAMAQLKDPQLTAQVSAAVSAFLDNPKSLTISAKPAQPVPFAVLMAGGMGDPTTLPKTLGVTVTAND